MKNRFTYILGALLLSACTSEDVVNNTLSEDGQKTPITVVSNISTVRPVTRAVDGSFEKDDVLQAYIQHVKSNDAIPPVYSLVNEIGTAPRLAGFKVGTLTDNHHNEADNFTDHSESSILQVTDAQGLYWDDFSNSASAATDLRTEGHALQVKYGYCYNSGSASTALDNETGVLGWTVATNQSTGIKTSDLLYAKTQDPVAYVHGTNNTITGRDPYLTIPYTHAMSKVTVEVICDEGFSTTTNNFANAAVKLQGMNSVVTVNAPTAELSGFGIPAEITTIGTADASTPNIKKSFSALIAPTVMAENKVLAKIENVDGNNYEIKLTDAVLTNATSPANAWSTQLAAYNATAVTPATATGYNATNGGLTKPGVHYMITVTIKKQQIKVQATIQDWDTVTATGVGEINFTNDITTTGTIDENLLSFDLYQKGTAADANYANVTTYTYSGEPAAWTRNKEIYWPNGTDKFYFRALSPKTSTTAMANGEDVLWGTTAAYTWGTDNVAEGGLVAPRTGDVPLTFDHPMTKVTFILQNDPDAEESKKVNLDGAKIQLTNLISKGTLDLHEGSITPSTAEADKLAELFSGGLSTTYNSETKKATTEYQILIPQEIPNDSRIQITLADGTKYSAQLNQCVVENSTTYVNPWVRNTHYTYIITVGKEKIKFRALLKDWDEKEASGNATLDWDD